MKIPGVCLGQLNTITRSLYSSVTQLNVKRSKPGKSLAWETPFYPLSLKGLSPNAAELQQARRVVSK